MKESIIERSYYTERIRPYIGQPIIKIYRTKTYWEKAVF